MKKMKDETLVKTGIYGLVGLIIFSVWMMLQGCGGTSTLCPAPDGQPSVICKLSDKMVMTPETLSQVLQVSNMIALEENIYTARDANKFVDRILHDIQKVRDQGISISYLEAVNYVNKRFKLLSLKAQAAFIIINPGDLATKEINIPLSEYDLGLLLKHLWKQKAIIGVYL